MDMSRRLTRSQTAPRAHFNTLYEEYQALIGGLLVKLPIDVSTPIAPTCEDPELNHFQDFSTLFNELTFDEQNIAGFSEAFGLASTDVIDSVENVAIFPMDSFHCVQTDFPIATESDELILNFVFDEESANCIPIDALLEDACMPIIGYQEFTLGESCTTDLVHLQPLDETYCESSCWDEYMRAFGIATLAEELQYTLSV